VADLGVWAQLARANATGRARRVFTLADSARAGGLTAATVVGARGELKPALGQPSPSWPALTTRSGALPSREPTSMVQLDLADAVHRHAPEWLWANEASLPY
jgi:hypothetical protein